MGDEKVSYPAPLKNDSRFATWSQQMDEVLEKITHRWRGERERVNRDGTTEWITPEDANPLMNDAGIDYVISQIHPIANKNTFLSNISDAAEAYRVARVKGMSIAEALFLNYKEYDIQPENFKDICLSIVCVYLLALKRPIREGERKFLMNAGIEQKIEQIMASGGGFRIFGKG